MQQLTTKAAPSNAWHAGRGCGQSKASSNTAHSHSITFRNHLGQVVGHLVDGWLTKRVDTRLHQLRVPPAWACDVAHIEQLRQLGARGVKLIDERGRIWTAPLARWRGAQTIDRKHGEQYVLMLSKWDVEDSMGPRQLKLFEVAR